MTHALVELDARELLALLALVRARQMDLDRMAQGMEEAEGMDLQRHNALKTLRPQIDALQDLTLKLEGALAEIERARGQPGA